MKKNLLCSAIVLLMLIQYSTFAQAPQRFKYQSLARNSSGSPITSSNIGLRINIRDLTSSGTVVYSEAHTATTDAFGVFTISVGGGTVLSGNITSVDWGSGAKFIEVGVDFSGGSTYTVMGVSQLLSVPYALFSENSTPGEDGLDGLNILNGTSDPIASIGVDGEFYINTTNKTLFGPKASGSWPSGISLIGPAGSPGILTPGAAAGNTPYWNGTTWVTNNSNIFNNGGNVGIGTTTPTTKLDIAGSIKMVDGTQGTGKVLTSDANGLASWAVAGGSSGWGLTGNSGTVDGTNFIGTSDNKPLNFRVNNLKAGRIDQTGPTFLGYQAGNNNSSSDNTGIGYQASYLNTTGVGNTSTGYQALYSNTTGSGNTATGAASLYGNSTGSDNTGYGVRTLALNTTGRRNTAIGYRTLHNNSGDHNTATGSEAMFYNTTGNLNTAYGFRSLFHNTTGGNNTSIGSEALWVNTTGANNTAIGTSSLLSNETGNRNSALGDLTLYNNTTGSLNTASGSSALYSNTTGNSNTALGVEALYSNTSGGVNVAIGRDALRSNTVGTYNVAHGNSALYGNTTGTFNTAVGTSALFYNIDGHSNTAIGAGAYGSGPGSGTAFSNSTAIGTGSIITASNMVRLGNASVTSINGAVAFSVVSDGRFKKDITEEVIGIPFIMKLRPVTYHIDLDKMNQFTKTPDLFRSKESELLKEKILQSGFIAQEVEKAAEELGYDFSGIDKPDNEADYYGLRYSEFTVPLVKAVQEQQVMITELQTEIQLLKDLIKQKSSEITALESKNNLLKSSLESRFKRVEEMLNASAKK